jgi:hypothetical protein
MYFLVGNVRKCTFFLFFYRNFYSVLFGKKAKMPEKTRKFSKIWGKVLKILLSFLCVFLTRISVLGNCRIPCMSKMAILPPPKKGGQKRCFFFFTLFWAYWFWPNISAGPCEFTTKVDQIFFHDGKFKPSENRCNRRVDSSGRKTGVFSLSWAFFRLFS